MARLEWLDKFLTLYAFGDVDDFKEALALKEQHMPHTLYRYRALTAQKNIDNVLDEVCKGTIYLAKPDEMNDPFDSCSIFKEENINSDDKFKARHMIAMKPHLSEEEFKKVFQSKEWLIELNKVVAEKEVQDSTMKRIKLQRVLMEITLGGFSDVNRAWNDMFNDVARIACFTESNTNLPMWTHYAGGHTGICVEYNIEKLLDRLKRNRMLPVKYVSELPDIIKIYRDNEKVRSKVLEYILLHKLKDWSYEKEWRLILTVGDWYISEEAVPEDFWDKGKVEKFMLPSKIYLGYKICKAYEKLFCKVCKPLGIEVYKMVRTESGLLPVACKDDEDNE